MNSRDHIFRRALVFAGIFVPLSCGRSEVSSHAELRSALAAVRPGEGRLVGAPWRSARPSRKRAENLSAAIVLLRDIEAATAARSADSTERRARNLVPLLAGQTDLALRTLERATEDEPENGVAWSDLAVAHLVKFEQSTDPLDLLLSVGASTRALRRSPRVAAIYFNRALALGKLSLRRSAISDWDQALLLEPDPLWRREAMTRRDDLARELETRTEPPSTSELLHAAELNDPRLLAKLVGRDPQFVREYVERELPRQWARSQGSHPAEAASDLETVRTIAAQLAATNGERMMLETVRGIDRARLDSGDRGLRLARAFGSYDQGMTLLGAGQYSEALPWLEASYTKLKSAGSPFRQWAAIQIAHCHYQSADYVGARRWLEPLRSTTIRSQYGALYARTQWLWALIESINGRISSATEAYASSLASYEALGEEANAAKIRALMADDQATLGQTPNAWRALYPSLLSRKAELRPEKRYWVLFTASWFSFKLGEPEVALSFQDEGLAVLLRAGLRQQAVGALRWRASLLEGLKRSREAREALDQAWSALGLVEEPKVRRTFEADLRIARGRLCRGTAPDQALVDFNKAIEIFRQTSYHYGLAEALFERSRLLRQLGSFESADRDLASAIGEIELQRGSIDAPEDRVTYLDRLREIYDDWTEAEFVEGRSPEEVLEGHERAKARVLWEAFASQGRVRDDFERLAKENGSATSEPWKTALPAGTAVVEFALLPKRTLIWVLRPGHRLELLKIPAQSDRIESLSISLLKSLRDKKSRRANDLSGALFDALIRPVLPLLVPGESLAIIPDRALHLVPFSLLVDRATGRYLIEDHAISVAPSLRLYLAGLRRSRALAGLGQPRALVFAAPDFDRDLEPSLQPLTAGEIDGRVTALFPGSMVLRGHEAKRSTFLELAPAFELLYFGGHSVLNGEVPGFSRMLFARDSADPLRGALYASNILQMRLPRTRLVVLASCQTGAGSVSSTEGVQSLARPFLALGVPNVVAAYWSVGDLQTAQFFERFFGHLSESLNPETALRATKCDFIREERDRSPWRWGAFEVIGAGK